MTKQTGLIGELSPCGHPASLIIKSAGSDYQFCELCEALSRAKDAEDMEVRLHAEIVKYRTALNQIAWPTHFPSDKEPRHIAVTALRIG